MAGFVIIGAGPAGLSCAIALREAGHEVTLIEASHQVGGMARTIRLFDQRVDLGPHRFFTNSRRVWDFWFRFVGQDFTRVKRKTRILFNGQWIEYPLLPLDVLKGLGVTEATRAISSYLPELLRFHRSPPNHFREFGTRRFGSYIFERFFKGYSEKLWGIPCEQIDAGWAHQRIGKFSLLEAAKAWIFQGSAKSHRTALAEFFYPHQGTGIVYERIAEEFKRQGGHLHLGSPVTRLSQVQKKSGQTQSGSSESNWRIETSGGLVVFASNVVSTIPLPHLIQCLSAPQDVLAEVNRLRYRNSILVYVEIADRHLFSDNWIYIQSSLFRVGRITNFRNWCPSLYGTSNSTVLCLEYWCFDHDEIWSWSEALLTELAKVELQKLELLKPSTQIQRSAVIRLPKVYPLYEVGFREHLQRVQKFVDAQSGLQVIGRAGAFQYNNQDHSILMGLMMAERVSKGSASGLWDFNSDFEYQEKSQRVESR